MNSAARAAGFSNLNVASIAANPNHNSASGGATGTQYVGDTLYALVFKGASSSSYLNSTRKVKDDDTWTYTWYASDVQSQSSLPDDADAIPGATGSSLTLTEDMVGKYLFVKVTAADGTTASGPRSAKINGTHRGVGPVQRLVIADDLLDSSFVCIQDSASETSSFSCVEGSLKAGTTLYANAYDGGNAKKTRIQPKDEWVYRWLAYDGQEDSNEAVCEVVAEKTGDASLAIDDELAKRFSGKYLRVEVSGNGQTIIGPVRTYNTPGPVVAAGQIMVNHIVLAYNDDDFGDDYESVPAAHVGDTVKAAAYYLDGFTPTDLCRGDQVDFSWQIADTAEGPFTEVATGDSWTVGSYAGKYLKVVAQAKQGVPGHDVCETEAGRILAAGVHKLSSVSIVNKGYGALETGTVLQVQAYESDGAWGEKPVAENVTYTWSWTDQDPSSYEFDPKTSWHVIGGVSGSSFEVPASFRGRWVSVAAYAGDNKVSTEDGYWSDAAGPFKAPGTITLYYAALDKKRGDDTFVYKAGEVIGVTARATSAAGTAGDYLDADLLTYAWRIADSPDGPYVSLDDENANASSFAIPSSYVGKYLECEVSAGDNTMIAGPMRYAIAEAPEKVTYELSSVAAASSGSLVQVGQVMTPCAKYLSHGYETDLPSEAEVTYCWYAADDASGAGARAVLGADAATGALKLTADLQGSYVYVVANAGENEVRSEPLLVEAAQVRRLAAAVKVTGVTAHRPGEEFTTEAWIPATEYTWTSDARKSAWDAFAHVLDDAGYFYDLTGACPYSITTPDKMRTLAQSASAPWSYWAFFVNGEYGTSLPSGYTLKDGDTVELRYVDATGQQAPSGEVAVNPSAEHPDLGVQWGGYLNGGAGSVAQGVATPTESASAAWEYGLLTDAERKAGAFPAASDPLIVGGSVYIVSGTSIYAPTRSLARLAVIDPATGNVARRVTLARPMDDTCRPVYSDGMVIIPLAEGYVQAVSASTLETIWVAEGIAGAQAISTLTVRDGYVYVATADLLGSGWNPPALSGTVRRINVRTGALAGSACNDKAGYYWSGGVVVGDYFLVPDDAGTVTAYRADLSRAMNALKLGDSSIRASLVTDGQFVYAVSKDGVLHKLSVGADGAIAEVAKVPFAAYATSTPTVHNGKAYVGGSLPSYKGVLAVIDLATMQVQKVSAADGEALPAEVKGTPLVTVHDDATYVYFTCNTTPGGVYVYRLGDAEASALFTPTGDRADYCMSSVAVGTDGMLYYTNDSGTLFALKGASASSAESGKQPGSKDPQGEGQGKPQTKPNESPHKKPGPQDGGVQGGTQAGAGGKVAGPAGKVGVPAAHKPLALGALPAATDATPAAPALLAEDAASGSAGGERSVARATATTLGADGAGADVAAAPDGGGALDAPQDAGVNGWAVAGLLLGVAGLATALYLLLARKREGSE